MTWKFRGLPLIQKHRSAKIYIGSKFLACSKSEHNSIGVFQKVIIKALKTNAIIKIGNNVGVSGATISGSEITIGNNVLIGSGALITDNDAHPVHPYERDIMSKVQQCPIIINDDVFIGARSIILKGVEIGRGSVIGAGSVVVNDIPPMCVAAGNPAKIIKKIS